MNWKNQTIWTGDNLPIMRGMNSGCVDLIYLDPPFNSNHDYAAPIGSEAAGGAFKDTWGLSDLDSSWFDLMAGKHPKVHKIISAALSKSDMAYLIYMAPRLIEMKRLLKDTGSIYLHCDPTMSHYLKLLMDAVFGKGNFRNEIIWHYKKWTNAAKYFQRNHDIVLFYTVSEKYKFNKQYEESEGKNKLILRGWDWNTVNGKRQLIVYDREKSKGEIGKVGINWHSVVYMDDKPQGVAMADLWSGIPYLRNTSKERTGYPTQKPLALLERIIETSTDKDDMILDPFCGCATACVAAHRLHRNWVGIDLSPKALELTKMRINKEPIIHALNNKGIHRTDIPQRTDLGKIRAYNSMYNKKELYGSQAGNCKGCNTYFQLRNLEVDHIIASSQGGTDLIENLQLLCGSCNRIKGKRGMEYLIMKLNELNIKSNEKVQILIVLEDLTGHVKIEGEPQKLVRSYATLIDGTILQEEMGTTEKIAYIKFMNVSRDADGHGPLFDEKLGKGNWYLVLDPSGKLLTGPLQVNEWVKRRYSTK